MELLFNNKIKRGVTRYLVRWRVHTSAADKWLLAEELLHCPEKVAEYESSPAARPQRAGYVAPPQPPAPLLAPAGFRLATGAELRSGAALVGAWVLYRWPLEGWVAGRVRRVCRRGGFSHVVGYASSSPLGAVVVDTLLDALSHGPAGRWHLPGWCWRAGRPAPHGVWLGCDLRVRDPRLSFSGMTVMVFRAQAPARGQSRRYVIGP